MSTSIAARKVFTHTRCSSCSYSVLNAFTAAFGLTLRHPPQAARLVRPTTLRYPRLGPTLATRTLATSHSLFSDDPTFGLRQDGDAMPDEKVEKLVSRLEDVDIDLDAEDPQISPELEFELLEIIGEMDKERPDMNSAIAADLVPEEGSGIPADYIPQVLTQLSPDVVEKMSAQELFDQIEEKVKILEAFILSEANSQEAAATGEEGNARRSGDVQEFRLDVVVEDTTDTPKVAATREEAVVVEADGTVPELAESEHMQRLTETKDGGTVDGSASAQNAMSRQEQIDELEEVESVYSTAEEAYEPEESIEDFDNAIDESQEIIPWYLDMPQDPPPRPFISPFIEELPSLPAGPPVYLEPLLEHLSKELGLSKFKLYDLRGIDPIPALGPNIIMVICTARSGRHLHIASDKACRYLRSTHKVRSFADGIVGRGELKLRQKRQKRKGKVLTEAEEDALKVGWVCINTGDGIVVQVLTEDKREEVNLEGLWERKLDTSNKRKAKLRIVGDGDDAHFEMGDGSTSKPEPRSKKEVHERKSFDSAEFDPLTAPGSEKVVWKKQWNPPSKEQRTRVNSRRYYSTSVMPAVHSAIPSSQIPFPTADPSLDDLVSTGDYEKLGVRFAGHRTPEQTLLLLRCHLQHLMLSTPNSAINDKTLSPSIHSRHNTPFFETFNGAMPQDPQPVHYFLQTLLFIRAHQLDPSVYPVIDFTNIPQRMMISGLDVPPELYEAVLRGLATADLYSTLDKHTMSSWTTSVSRKLSFMLDVVKDMERSMTSLRTDSDVFTSFWLAMAPADTLKYISTLGDPDCPRSYPLPPSEMFKRAFDHRSDLLRRLHFETYDLVTFKPSYRSLTPSSLKTNALVNADSWLYHIKRSNSTTPAGKALIGIPLHIQLIFTTLARANQFDSFFSYYRRLLTFGLRRPPALFTLTFELVAREGGPPEALYVLRVLLDDFWRENPDKVFRDGTAEALSACLRIVEEQIGPAAMGEFQEIKWILDRHLREVEEEKRV